MISRRKFIKVIGITEQTKYKIEKLAEKYGYSQVTILEYLLNGKISLNELNEQRNTKTKS